MADIIDRLVEFLREGGPCKNTDNECKSTDARANCDCAIAADAIEHLRRENEHLREGQPQARSRGGL